MFVMTLVGAIISQLLSLYKELDGCAPFLKKAFPKKTARWYFVANSLLLPLVGTTLAFIILEPDNVKTCFLAGLTWCTTLQTLGIKTRQDD